MKENEGLGQLYQKVLLELAYTHDANYLFKCIDDKRKDEDKKWNYIYEIEYKLINDRYEDFLSFRKSNISIGFNNLNDLTTFNQTRCESIKKLLSIHSIEPINKAKLIYSFKQYCELIENTSYLKNGLKEYLLYSSLKEDISFFKMSNLILLNPFYKNNLVFWWIRTLRDNSSIFSLFYDDGKSYWLFIFILFFYLFTFLNKEIEKENNSKERDEDYVNECSNYISAIIELLNENGKGLNNQTKTLRGEFKNNVSYYCKELINNLNFLLDIYDSIDYYYFDGYMHKAGQSYCNDFVFDKEFLLTCYFELLFNYEFELDKNKFKEELDKLNKENKKCVKKVLIKQINENNKFRSNFNSGFTNFYLDHKRNNIENIEDGLFDIIKNFNNNVSLFDESDEKAFIKDDIKVKINNFKEKFNEYIDESINLENVRFKPINLIYKKNSRNLNISFLNEFINDYINAELENYLISLNLNIVETSNFKNNKEKEDSLEDNLIKNKLTIFNDIDLFHLLNKPKCFKFERDFNVKQNFFIKENTIKFNIEFNLNKEIERKLNDDQINIKINEEYQLINGFFRYSEYNNKYDYKLLSRDELFNQIKEDYIYFELEYRIKFKDINKEDILLIK